MWILDSLNNAIDSWKEFFDDWKEYISGFFDENNIDLKKIDSVINSSKWIVWEWFDYVSNKYEQWNLDLLNDSLKSWNELFNDLKNDYKKYFLKIKWINVIDELDWFANKSRLSSYTIYWEFKKHVDQLQKKNPDFEMDKQFIDESLDTLDFYLTFNPSSRDLIEKSLNFEDSHLDELWVENWDMSKVINAFTNIYMRSIPLRHRKSSLESKQLIISKGKLDLIISEIKPLLKWNISIKVTEYYHDSNWKAIFDEWKIVNISNWKTKNKDLWNKRLKNLWLNESIWNEEYVKNKTFDLIVQFEARKWFDTNSYIDIAKIPTIWYWFTRWPDWRKVKMWDKMDIEYGKKYLKALIDRLYKHVDKYQWLTDNMKIWLISFFYNNWTSRKHKNNFYKYLEKWDYDKLINHIGLFNKISVKEKVNWEIIKVLKPVDWLTTRRRREQEIMRA